MIATPDPVGQGDVLTYDVTVTNKNPIDVATVTVQLPIPSGMGSCQAFSDNGSTPTGCVIGRNVVWSLGTLAAGASRTVQAVFTTNASTTSLPDGTIIHGTVSAADGAADIAMAAADVVVQGTAPLMLGIADDADPVKVGDHVEYTLRFGNVGGAAQLSTSLVVTLPAGMTATATTGGGMIAGNIVTWTLGALNAGDSGERRLTVSVDGLGASDPLVRVTQAALTSAGASARASEVTTLVGTVPLGLVMIATPDPVAQNGIITYEVTVTNRQAVDAGVQVQMQIPAGVSSCQAFSDSGSAANGCIVGRYVTWNLGTVPSGASRTVSAAYTAGALAADPNGTILHTTASAEDAAGNSAHAAVSSAVTGNASLMLGIAADADPVQVGDHVEYTLRFGNAGGAAQLSTVLTVTLPAGTTATATTGSGVISGNTVTWTLGTLNAGDTGERRVTVSVDDLGAADPLVRLTRAVVQSTAASARANEVTTVAASLGFGLVMIATPDPVGQNGILTYELTVTNRQGVDAAGVAVRTQIPTGVSSCQAISDGGSAPSGCVLGRDVAWSLGTIPAGGSRTVSVVYTASALATDPNGTILHTTGRADDAGGSSARADVSAAVLGNAPLMLGIADDADPVRVGDQLEYTFRFGNVGGAAQLSTVLTVTLPAGTTATATTGSGVISGNTVTWTLGTLNAGDTGERRVTVSVDDLGAADPLVRLTRAVVQSTAASARASEVTTVASSIGLGLVMIATPDPVGQNEVLTYELTVTNRQGVDAAGVAVRTQIPSGVSSCQAISDAGTAPNGCIVGRDVAWSLGTIPAGGSRTVSVVYTAAALATDPNGTILHTTGRADDAGGNSARADGSSAVFGSGPLMLGIADDADPVLAGDSIVYTLRFGNRGGSAQLGTVLTVTLPAGTTPTAVAEGGVVSGNTVTWTVGTLNFGDSGERQLTVTVDDLGAADPLVRLTRAVVASTTTSARASEVTSVAASVGLGLVVVATPDPVGRNAVLTYQLTVTNTGPADVADVEIRMQIPTGVAACRSFSDSGTAANGCVLGRDVVWSLGTLTTGANHTVTAAFVTVSSAPPLTNGTIIHATARSDDAGGDAARADTSTAVFQ